MIIGEGTIIEPGVLVDHSVVIGSMCEYTGAIVLLVNKDNLSSKNAVASAGFGFERDTDGTPVRLPIWWVRIGRNVEMGIHGGMCRHRAYGC